jgi:hypothetical protein
MSRSSGVHTRLAKDFSRTSITPEKASVEAIVPDRLRPDDDEVLNFALARGDARAGMGHNLAQNSPRSEYHD